MPETTLEQVDDAAAPAENPSSQPGSGEGPPLVFDLEIEYGPDEVGGWGHAERMGVAVAVMAPLVGDKEPFPEFAFYRKHELAALRERLEAARFVVGWNHVAFDYRVLKGQGVRVRQKRNVDLCAALRKATGRMWSLAGVSEATLREGKGIDSALLPRLWRDGQEEIVAKACARHVWLTMRLWNQLADGPGRLILPGARIVSRWQLRRRGVHLRYGGQP